MPHATLKTRQHFKQTKAIYEHMVSLTEFEEDTKFDILYAASDIAKLFNNTVKVEDFPEDAPKNVFLQELLNGRIHSVKKEKKPSKIRKYFSENEDDFDNETYFTEPTRLYDYDEETFPDYEIAAYAKVKQLSAQTSLW